MLNPNQSMLVVPAAARANGGDVDQPNVNAAAVVSYLGQAEASHVITGVAWSYTETPTGGGLKIEDGAGRTVFAIDITAAGPGVIYFPVPKKSRPNTALTVTLLAGGATNSGSLSVLNHWTEPD